MYILIFFLALGIITYMTNKSNDVESNSEFLKWGNQELLIIGILFLVACVLQVLDNIIPKLFLVVYLLGSVLALIYANKNREKNIQEYKKQVEQIFESVNKLVKSKEIDYSELPFKIEKDGEKINKITVAMEEPSKFTDGTCTNAVYSLNRYFPYYEWQFNVNYQGQETVFFGQKLPPRVAKWPGSDLRGSRYIPLGVNGDSEVGLNLGEKNPGASMFVFEDGSKAKTSTLPSAPQFLTVGSPLSLNTVVPTTKGYKTIRNIGFGDLVFNSSNKPVCVIGKSEINNAEKVNKFIISNDRTDIEIIADGIHYFPVVVEGKEEQLKSSEILNLFNKEQNMSFIGFNNGTKTLFDLVFAEEIDGEQVACIMVDSEDHLFQITDKEEINWINLSEEERSNGYLYDSCLTHNTGGGKAIWVEQEIW